MDPQPQRSWWTRNWPWLAPVGCLAPVLVCCGCGGLIALFYFGTIKGSEPYTKSLALAQANPQVKTALGESIEAGLWVGGSIELKNNDGNADITYPIQGASGSGQVHVVAKKTAGVWEYSLMELFINGSGERIDLLAGANSHAQPDEAAPPSGAVEEAAPPAADASLPAVNASSENN